MPPRRARGQPLHHIFALGRSLSLEEGPEGARLTAAGEGAPAVVRPLMVAMRWPGRRPPARVHVRLDGRELSLDVEALADGLGRVVLPDSSGMPAEMETRS